MENAEDTSTSLAKQTGSLESVKEHFKELKAFYTQTLKPDVDYGTIPGVEKPCLYKAGAEKLKLLFNMSVEVNRTGETLLIPEQFYDCSYKATVRKSDGTLSAECEGSCNTMEDKYRYTYQTRAAQPQPSDADIIALAREKKGRWKGFDGIQYWQDKTENMGRLAIKNTIQKMAQKRAIVGAILIATGASTIFTQDTGKGDESDISEDTINEAMEELSKVATIDDLKDLVSRYEQVYNAETQFTKAAKELKEKLKKN